MTGFFLLGIVSAMAKAPAQSPQEDAKQLGWVSADNVCGGYFVSKNETQVPFSDSPVTLSADNAELAYNGISTAKGNVKIAQPGKTIVGEKAQIDLQNRWYHLEDAIYRFLIGKSLNAWGSASEVTAPPSNITELKDISYSTCPPQSSVWHLTAKRMELDQNEGRGQAYNAVLFIKDIPVFYTPYINFPIDDRRKTGFLYPQLIFGSDSGFGMGFPFYWNIAPNQDDTMTPYYYTKRGFRLSNQYRYLTQNSSGQVNFSVLPNDWAFRQFKQTAPDQVPANTPGLDALANATDMRNYFNWQHQTQFNQDWLGSINYTRVSDDYYPTDIGDVPMIAQNQLLQQGQLLYKGDYFNFLANMQAFQTLHPVNQTLVLNQYNMLPQLLLTNRFSPKFNQLNYEYTLEAVNFTQAQNPGQQLPSPSGQRFNAVPAISFPFMDLAGYFTPRLAYELTQYKIGDQLPGFETSITRAVPLFDIDSGLYFERNTHFFAHDYTETLEPRLFYLYVPYRNQDQIPIFDSSVQPFNFDQLFLLNRFSGSDRIGDANQLSAALTTRFLDKKTGDEKFLAAIGIIRYFQARQVTSLCQSSDLACQDAVLYAAGSISPTSPVSPIVSRLQYHFNPYWSTTIDDAWDPNVGQNQNTTWGFQYSPAVNNVFNVGYTFVRNGDYWKLPVNSFVPAPARGSSQYNLSQPVTSFAWGLNDRWNVLGSFSYSINQHHALTYFGGVEYTGCCWATQVVLARNFTSFDAFGIPQYNTGVYVQFAFRGLAKVAGNDPTALLMTNIPGYTPTFGSI